MLSNIEPLAREIAERVCRRCEAMNPSSAPMSAEQVQAWVEAHWECAAAELEAGVMDEDGRPIPSADWDCGLAAYLERKRACRHDQHDCGA